MARKGWLAAEGLMDAVDEGTLWDAVLAAGAGRTDVAGLVPASLFLCETRVDLIH